MSFDSVSFLIFFPVVTTLYFLCPHAYRWGLLLVASAIFYMAFVPVYILILAVTIVVDYIAGRCIESAPPGRKHLFLIVSILVNVGFLAFFKYFNFFNQNFALIARLLHQPYPISNLAILLPIGLSFHTFQAMSYTIEVYRGRQKAERHFGVFALYVLFYPQLVAGPIERPQNLLHQFYEKHDFDYDRVVSGLKLMCWGFFKKIVIANGMAQLVNSVYGHPRTHAGPELLFATLWFSFQIYADFSGYTDIARGVAKFLGIDLMINFRLPYFSKGPSEFWQRWHISLSTWLRDYLYIPLGGNRQGSLRTYRNLLLTMLIGGLWHGAAWSFLLWGLYQGLILCASRLLSLEPTHGRDSEPRGSWLDPLWMALFFVVTCYGWLLFRANSLGQIARFTHILVTGPYRFSLDMHRPTFAALVGLPVLLILEMLEYRTGSVRYYEKFPTPLRGALYALFIFLILLGSSNEPTQFIYFQF